VPNDFGVRIMRFEFFNQLTEGFPLFGCEIIMRLAPDIDAADQTDPHAAIVPRPRMGAGEIEMPSFLNRAVTPDNPVIADPRPTVALVPFVDFSRTDILIGPGRRTMKDDFIGQPANGGH